MLNTVRLAALVVVVVLAAPAATVSAAVRMPIGFFDDASFRWSAQAEQNLSAAARAGASIVYTTADWSQIAPRKPAHPLDGNDPAYRLHDLDALVGAAGRHGLQVMIDISRTPGWANGGQSPNHPPANLADLTRFAQMLAARYDGLSNRGLVLRWSIWNEPNLDLFLTPQFIGTHIVSPAIYAKLYQAGYEGIKAGDPRALVAIGETSNRGRGRPLPGLSASVAPATFARLLAHVAPQLHFTAWATHPYPTNPALGPTQKVRWPNVTMTELTRFGASLARWFHRRVPIWITEYGEQTRPQFSGGVSYAQQARDAKTALAMAAGNPYVEMFVWFTFRDSPATWQSGLETSAGTEKPAYEAFASVARTISGQSEVVRAGARTAIAIFVPFIAYHDVPGTPLRIRYRIYVGTTLVASGLQRSSLAADDAVTFVANFEPRGARSYLVTANVSDRHGNHDDHAIAISVLA